MAAVNPITRLYEGDHHSEPDPANPADLWCGGCLAWTHRRAWHHHAWHTPATQPAPTR